MVRTVTVPIYVSKVKQLDINFIDTTRETLSIESGTIGVGVRENDTVVSGNITHISRYKEQAPYIYDNLYLNGVNGESDIALIDILQIENQQSKLAAVFKEGMYDIGKETYPLYGDKAIVTRMDNTSIELDIPFGVVENLTLTTYKRVKGFPHIFMQYKEVEDDSLIGDLVEEGREDGFSRIPQYMYDVEDREVYVNFMPYDIKSYNEVDYDTATTDIINAYSDKIGTSNGKSWQTYTSTIFPCKENSVNIFTCTTIDNTRDNLIPWTYVDNILEYDATDYVCTFDHDTGRLVFGGVIEMPATVTLVEPLAAGETGVLVLLDATNIPQQGKANIGGFTYAWNGKNGNTLFLTQRANVALAVVTGTYVVTPLQTSAIPENGSAIWLAYDPAIRLEYSITESDVIRRKDMLAPYTMANNESIAFIKRKESIVDKIRLTVKDKNMVRLNNGESYYGPVYSNEEVLVLEGICYDVYNEPVADSYVRVYIVSGDGTLDYLPEQYIYTNSEGKFWVNYIPSNERWNVYYSTDKNVRYVEDETHLTLFSLEGSEDPVFGDLALSHIYAITKDDAAQGTVGKRIPIVEAFKEYPDVQDYYGVPLSTTPYELTESDEGILVIGTVDFDLFLEDYEGGTVTVLLETPAGPIQELERNIVAIKRVQNIWSDLSVAFADRYHTYVVYVQDVISTVGEVKSIYVRSRYDVQYDATVLNGRKSIMRTRVGTTPGSYNAVSYTQWVSGDEPTDLPTDREWLHPASETVTTIYKGITPSRIVSSNTIAVQGTIPAPDSTNINEKLAGYCVYAGKVISIQAESKIQPHYNYSIKSNLVRIFMDVNPIDNGTIATDTSYIPYGFRLVSDEYEGASTISGPTYLTVNDVRHKSTTGEQKFPIYSYIRSDGNIQYEEPYSDNHAYGGFTLEIIASE